VLANRGANVAQVRLILEDAPERRIRDLTIQRVGT